MKFGTPFIDGENWMFVVGVYRVGDELTISLGFFYIVITLYDA